MMKDAEKKAAKARAAAEKLQKTIDEKRNPGVAQQNLTPRRAQQIAGMAQEADHLEGVQRCLERLAVWHVAPTVDMMGVPNLGTAAAMKRFLSYARHGCKLPSADGWQKDDRAKLIKAGIASDEAMEHAWEKLQPAYGDRREKTPEELFKEAERELLGVKIPGFFPTPAPICDYLVELAEIEDDMWVLEPSAGKGDLVAAIRRSVEEVKIDACEINMTLAQMLADRFVSDDFYHNWPGDVMTLPLGKFDRVVMNPPFEKFQDRAHVLRCLNLLNPGGRLVSIMGAMACNEQARGYQAFRDALDEVCDSWEVVDMERGSFTGKEAFRQTGVSTQILIAEKK